MDSEVIWKGAVYNDHAGNIDMLLNEKHEGKSNTQLLE